MIYTLFASCPRGLETILSQELQQQGAHNLSHIDGGVYAQADLATVYRANLHSRTAGRILLQLAQAPVRNENDLYQLATSVNWPQWFEVSRSIKVRAEGRRAPLKNIDFAALKVKDGVCDVFRRQVGSRPNVDKHQPDVRLHVFIDDKRATLFIDTSGEALFKRGYRQDSGEAPLRENLAAGLLLAAGYDGNQPFQDPFCGSGTLAIEAALIAAGLPANGQRRFGFENLNNFDAALWQTIQKQAQTARRQSPMPPIAASDNDPRMVALTRRNAQAAGVAEYLDIRCADVCDARPNGENGLIISNPPYGVRLSDIQAMQALYPQLGSWLKQHYAGWLAGLFTADRDLPKGLRLTPKRKMPLYNGKLDCRLFLFDMVAGSKRKNVHTDASE